MKLATLPRLAALGLLALGTVACTPAERAFDRAAGTNVSNAFPAQSDGTRVNPPGTALERATDRAVGTNLSGANDATTTTTQPTTTRRTRR